jgi:hypothetical protein
VTVPPGEGFEVTVTARFDPLALREWDLRSHELLWDEGKLARLEIDGWVSVTEVSGAGTPVPEGDVAAVPYYEAPRRQSCAGLSPRQPFHLAGEGDIAPQGWVNPCPQGADVAPLLLSGEDPAESATDASWPPKVDIVAVGTSYGLADPSVPSSPMLLTFAVASAGAASLPLDTEFRVYLDYDKDGSYDEVVFNAYGNDLDLVGAEQAFVVVHSKLRPDGITPDRGTISGTLLFQTWDLADQTAILNVAADELNNGLFSLDSGSASLNFAVAVYDAAEDYPVGAGDYLGFDEAPDEMFLPEPVQFSWDQARADCLHLADTEGNDTGLLGEMTVQVPANATSLQPFGLLLACEPPAEPADVGVMFVNFTNAQGTSAGFDIRRGRLGGAPEPNKVFLPYLSQGQALVPFLSVPMQHGGGSAGGRATYTQRGRTLEVQVGLADVPASPAHPAAIRSGPCSRPGASRWDLYPVENGRSDTVLQDVQLAEVANGLHSLNVHSSRTNMAAILSCGDIPAWP